MNENSMEKNWGQKVRIGSIRVSRISVKQRNKVELDFLL